MAFLVVAAGALVAVLAERRRPQPPTQHRWSLPAQLDRRDFARPESPWLVAVFTSATCKSCEETMVKVRAVASDAVAVDEVEVKDRPELHRRYAVDAVPAILVADGEGVVRATFVGPPPAGELWAAIERVRR